MSDADWTPPPMDYCLQRRAHDPHLRDAELLAEITSLGYRCSLQSMIQYLSYHGPARQQQRQRCTQCGSPQDYAISRGQEKCLLAPDRRLPVQVRPLAGERIASYLSRLASANHLPVPSLLAALPNWLAWRFTTHRLPPRDTTLTPRAAGSLHMLAILTGMPATSLARVLPVFGGRPRGPARAITACRRCTAVRGIARPVPVHHAAHETVCTRHGIWLPPPSLPQFDVTACPEIITAQYRARRILRRATPEQLIYAEVTVEQAASGHEPRWPSPPGWEQRAELLRTTNPGLSPSAEPELIRAARYPGIVAGAATVLTAAAGATRLIQFDASQLSAPWLRQIN